MKLILLSIAAIIFLNSCNTMVGLGQDTRLLGEGLEKTARKAAPNASTNESDTSGAPVF